MKEKIRILVIEDNEDDARLEIDELKSGGFDIEYELVETRKATREALATKHWDFIISDYSLPQFSGMDALTELKETGNDIPFIFVSGTIGEEIAVAAMKAGVHDYIMKDNLSRLIPAFERELREAEIRKQKREAEEAIKDERILLRTLIDNLPDMIYVKDAEGRKIVSNNADFEFLGYSSESEILGRTDEELYPGGKAYNGLETDRTIIESGKIIYNYEEKRTDPNGNERWFLTNKIPLFNDHDTITGLVNLSHDITERKLSEIALQEREQELEKQNMEYLALNREYLRLNDDLKESLRRIKAINEELTIAKSKAEEADNLKTAFLENMSHEVRTPLNGILGFAEFLKDPDLDKEQVEQYIGIIDASSKQLLTIINDILDISKIQAGQITLSKTGVDITDLLEGIYQENKDQAALKHLAFVLNKRDLDKNIVVTTDGTKLRQIINNLINNAIKFTAKGTIEFGFEVKEQILSFFVKDSGIGIAPEDQSLIFKPFSKVENAAARKYGGNGLGLAISRALVEKLGGTMSLASAINNGSIFTFTIPYSAPGIEPQRQRVKVESQVVENRAQATILIAEDEIYNYYSVEELLKPMKIKTLHAWNGLEAVEMVKNNEDISMVLMDIKMPEMDGLTATRMIKEMKPKLPVVAQTAYESREDRDKAKNAGVDYYLTKPISRVLFMEVMNMYIG
ncbi:MAG TPA: response regulator [Prolixibacteraceae bacterium]|nr:response regulator [Prolixibacteraceae bacterium]